MMDAYKEEIARLREQFRPRKETEASPEADAVVETGAESL
jgi:hypothetical protein